MSRTLSGIKRRSDWKVCHHLLTLMTIWMYLFICQIEIIHPIIIWQSSILIQLHSTQNSGASRTTPWLKRRISTSWISPACWHHAFLFWVGPRLYGIWTHKWLIYNCYSCHALFRKEMKIVPAIPRRPPINNWLCRRLLWCTWLSSWLGSLITVVIVLSNELLLFDHIIRLCFRIIRCILGSCIVISSTWVFLPKAVAADVVLVGIVYKRRFCKVGVGPSSTKNRILMLSFFIKTTRMRMFRRHASWKWSTLDTLRDSSSPLTSFFSIWRMSFAITIDIIIIFLRWWVITIVNSMFTSICILFLRIQQFTKTCMLLTMFIR